MALMADWFRRVFNEDAKEEERVVNSGTLNLMAAWREGEKLSAECWAMLTEKAEKLANDGDEDAYMAATLLIFVAVQKIFSHAKRSVDKFDAKSNGESPVAKMWKLLDAVFAETDPKKQIEVMQRMAREWNRDE